MGWVGDWQVQAGALRVQGHVGWVVAGAGAGDIPSAGSLITAAVEGALPAAASRTHFDPSPCCPALTPWRTQVEAMKRRDMYERSRALQRIQEDTEKTRQLMEQRAQLQVGRVVEGVVGWVGGWLDGWMASMWGIVRALLVMGMEDVACNWRWLQTVPEPASCMNRHSGWPCRMRGAWPTCSPPSSGSRSCRCVWRARLLLLQCRACLQRTSLQT